ncbi:MAG: hypothetical protein INR73_29100, partial [Williamsia sp.]|nr:hypothetical protein [Williamsia sp.]
MRIPLLLLTLLSFISAIAQDDDMPDLRSKKDNFKKVMEKDVRSDAATFTMSGIDESVGKPLLLSVPVTDYSRSSIHFEGNGIGVTITAGNFDATKHKLVYSDKYLIKIDNKAYYGRYSEVPKHNIASVQVKIDNDSIAIPATAYFDLYNPAFTYSDGSQVKTFAGVYQSADKRKVYIYMLNRDNLG